MYGHVVGMRQARCHSWRSHVRIEGSSVESTSPKSEVKVFMNSLSELSSRQGIKAMSHALTRP